MESPPLSNSEISRLVNASNRHGVFLHQAVAEVFKRGGGKMFQFKGISVEHPCSNPKTGPADLVVRGHISNPLMPPIPLTLTVECKRAYGVKRKLFFLPLGGTEGSFRTQKMRLFRALPRDFRTERSPKARTIWVDYQRGGPAFSGIPVAGSGMWVELHDHEEKNDKAGVALYEAANQACGSLVGVMKDDFAKSPFSGTNETIMHYLPMIVTNSPLYLMGGLDPIDLETGNADPAQAKVEEVPMIFYCHPYPLVDGIADPRGHSEDDGPEWRRAARFKETVLVIRAAHLTTLFSDENLATEIAGAMRSQQP